MALKGKKILSKDRFGLSKCISLCRSECNSERHSALVLLVIEFWLFNLATVLILGASGVWRRLIDFGSRHTYSLARRFTCSAEEEKWKNEWVSEWVKTVQTKVSKERRKETVLQRVMTILTVLISSLKEYCLPSADTVVSSSRSSSKHFSRLAVTLFSFTFGD